MVAAAPENVTVRNLPGSIYGWSKRAGWVVIKSKQMDQTNYCVSGDIGFEGVFSIPRQM